MHETIRYQLYVRNYFSIIGHLMLTVYNFFEVAGGAWSLLINYVKSE